MTQAVLMLSVPLQSYCAPQITPIIKQPTHGLGGLSNPQDLLRNINFHNALPATSTQSFPFPLPLSRSSDHCKDYNLMVGERPPEPDADTLEKIVRGRRLVVFEECLDSLVSMVRCQQASGCTKLVKSFNKEYRGSAVVVRGQCEDGHLFKIWESQPRVKRFFAGNVLLAASLFCSGLGFQEANDLFNNLGLRHISEKQYGHYWKYYCYPAIHAAWEEERKTVTQELQGSPVCLAGAGQYGTSERKAGHGVYTLTEMVSDRIVDLEVIGSSPCQSMVDMEKLGMEVCMSRTMAEGLDVACFASDRCEDIVESMKENYPHVVHQFNVQKYAKNISKRLKAASRARFCANIRPWIRTIQDHLVWSVQTSKNNEDLLREKWLSVIHHIVNQHSWEEGRLYKQCEHEDLSQKTLRETLWLKPGSPSFQKVQEIVTDPQLIEDLRHLTWNCQSGIPTMLHSTALKSSTTGPHSGLDELEARVKLAALQHNQNVGQRRTTGRVLSRKRMWDDRARRKNMATKRKTKQFLHRVQEHMSSHYLWTVMEGVLGICEGSTTPSYLPKDPPTPPCGSVTAKSAKSIDKHISRLGFKRRKCEN